jgi:hypothetical protein
MHKARSRRAGRAVVGIGTSTDLHEKRYDVIVSIGAGQGR